VALLCLIRLGHARRVARPPSPKSHSFPHLREDTLQSFAKLLEAFNPATAFQSAGSTLNAPPCAWRVRLQAVAASAESPAAQDVALEECLSLPKTVSESLQARGFHHATPIQKAALSRVEKGQNVLLHAETGSGKTLAYLLPSLLKIAADSNNGTVLILSPTRELCIQLQDEARALIRDGIDLGPHTVKLVAQGTSTNAVNLGDPQLCSVLIAQPTELCQLLGNGGNQETGELADVLGGSVSTLILDEVDALIPGQKDFKGKRHNKWMDKGMHPAEAIVKMMCSRSSRPDFQVLGASATLDKAVRRKLSKSLRRCKLIPKGELTLVSTVGAGQVSGNNARLTSVPSTIEHKTFELDSSTFDGDDGTDSAAEAVRQVHSTRKGTGNTLVFVSSSSKYLGGAQNMFRRLKEMELHPTLLSDELWPTSSRAQKRCPKRLRLRVNGEKAGADASERRAELNEKMRTASQSRLLVADTAATRGLHLDDVGTVLVLGQPSNFQQYLHLAGRTGRWPRREFPGASVVVTLAKNEELQKLKGWSKHNLGGDVEFQPFEVTGDDDDDSSSRSDLDVYETALSDAKLSSAMIDDEADANKLALA